MRPCVRSQRQQELVVAKAPIRRDHARRAGAEFAVEDTETSDRRCSNRRCTRRRPRPSRRRSPPTPARAGSPTGSRASGAASRRDCPDGSRPRIPTHRAFVRPFSVSAGKISIVAGRSAERARYRPAARASSRSSNAPVSVAASSGVSTISSGARFEIGRRARRAISDSTARGRSPR